MDFIVVITDEVLTVKDYDKSQKGKGRYRVDTMIDYNVNFDVDVCDGLIYYLIVPNGVRLEEDSWLYIYEVVDIHHVIVDCDVIIYYEKV